MSLSLSLSLSLRIHLSLSHTHTHTHIAKDKSTLQAEVHQLRSDVAYWKNETSVLSARLQEVYTPWSINVSHLYEIIDIPGSHCSTASRRSLLEESNFCVVSSAGRRFVLFFSFFFQCVSVTADRAMREHRVQARRLIWTLDYANRREALACKQVPGCVVRFSASKHR